MWASSPQTSGTLEGWETRWLTRKWTRETTKHDLPIVRTNGRDDTLTLADRNLCHELTGFRPYRSREGNDIVMTSFPHKMIGDGMEPERFLPLEKI